MKVRRPKGDINEWVRGQEKNEDLGRPGDMVIDESPPRGLVHLDVDFAIELAEEKALQNVEAYDKVVDEYDADDQGAERGEFGYGL